MVNNEKNTTSNSNRLQQIRGLFCLMVFFSHYIGLIPGMPEAINKFPLILFRDGRGGVIVFFILSGFFSNVSYKDNSIKSMIKHIIKKCLRIYPCIWITLAFAMLICNLELHMPIQARYFTSWFNGFWQQRVSFVDFIKQCTIVFIGNPDLINPPIWTMKIELYMIVLSPILLTPMRALACKYGKNSLWLVGGFTLELVGCLLLGIRFNILDIFCWAPIFLLGILASQLDLDKIKETHLRSPYRIIISIFAMVIGGFLVSIKCFIEFENTFIRDYIYALGIIALIYLIYIYNNHIFDFRLLSLFGDVSYEFYLVHFVVLLALRPIVPYVGYIIYGVLAWGISLIVAYCLMRVVSNRVRGIKKWINHW